MSSIMLKLAVQQSQNLLRKSCVISSTCSRRFERCRSSLARASSSSSSHSTISKYSTAAAAEPIPEPQVVGEEKVYPQKIQTIVEDISKLTLLEVADLNELLKKTLNISDAPMMMAGAVAAPAAQAEEEEVEVKQEKSLFTVKLTKYDEKKKVALIKEIKKLVPGMNLVQAKKFVESAPQNVKQDLSKEEAEQLKEALTTAGATVDIE